MTVKPIEQCFEEVEEPISKEEIIKLLLDPKNAIMHTDLPNPMAVTKLRLWQQEFHNRRLYRCERTVRAFCDNFELNMISEGRKREKAIVDMVSAISRVDNPNQPVKNHWFGPKEGKK